MKTGSRMVLSSGGLVRIGPLPVGPPYDTVVLEDNPFAYYRLGEPSGTVATDVGSNALNMTYFNSPTLGSASLLPANADTSVEFDGVNQYAITPAGTTLFDVEGGDCTFEAWIHIDSLAVVQTFLHFGNYNVSGAWGYRFFVDDDGHLSVETFQAAAFKSATSPIGTISTGVTYHVVITVEYLAAALSNVRFYIDGVEISSTLSWPAGLVDPVTARQARIAAFQGAGISGYVDGNMDEVAMYRSVLSPDRVLAHYNAGVG